MTSRIENDLLTRTGPDQPAGALLRRYWQPIALARELTDKPLAVRVMGEDLVLFRDEAGRLGLMGLLCPHRCADLSYGRIEDGGLRCLYHGWLFDVNGRCLEQPAEPAESAYKHEVTNPSYPCHEAAGVIFAYMGPGEAPLFPNFHFLSAPEAHVDQTKVFHACNYLQANEGNIDPAHLSFLHSFHQPQAERSQSAQSLQTILIKKTKPRIEIERTRYGIRIFALRDADEGKKYLRITNFVFPNLALFAGDGGRYGPGGYSVHWHVPIDDTSHWRYDFYYHPTSPLNKQELKAKHAAETDDQYFPRRTAANRYRQDREEMKTYSFTGMGRFFPSHDLFAVQTPGAIHDRTREHLVTGDIAIVTARRMLLDAMKGMSEGKEPPLVLRSANENVFNDLVVLGTLLDKGVDPRAHCAAIVSGGDYHAMKQQEPTHAG